MQTSFESIRYEVDEGMATIAFRRPERLNAYTPEMGEEAVAAFAAARESPDARVVILTGEGQAFCAGVDLDRFAAHMEGRAEGDGPRLGEEAFVRSFPLELVEYPKPVIAAINGVAYGVGVTMTLGCDVRIAARSARLGLNFAKLGVLPGLGSTHHLPRLVGLGRALEWVLSGAVLSAEEAARAGLVQRVVDDGAAYEEARALAGVMAGMRPEVLAAARRALRHGASVTLGEAMQEERRLAGQLRDPAG